MSTLLYWLKMNSAWYFRISLHERREKEARVQDVEVGVSERKRIQQVPKQHVHITHDREILAVSTC